MNTLNVLRDEELPVVIQLDDVTPDRFVSYYLENKMEIDSALAEKGVVKFKGIIINSLENFQRIVDSIATKFLDYIDGNSPRTKLSSHVYTSTEYDQTQKITMHNELSYSARWPGKLFFSCLKLADLGGETLIADSRKILKTMNPGIVSEIQKRGITYIRNLHSGKGIGPSWQETFETTEKSQLQKYCHEYGIDFEWKKNDTLCLKQSSKGIIEHRLTREKLWFNQIDQFHPSHLGKEMYEALSIMYDSPVNFPMYVRYGDGVEISESTVAEILDTIEKVTVAPPWRKNEFLIVDNECTCHGRNPFTGVRKVLVAMSE